MIQTSLTYQLAQMALENQYDRTALCWNIIALDYDNAALQEAVDLHKRVSVLFLNDEALWEEVPEKPVRPAFEIQQAKTLYTFHLLIARLVFRNDPVMYNALQLSGKREESLEGWSAQAMSFYAELCYLSPAMASYGIALAELRQAKAMIEAVVAHYLL